MRALLIPLSALLVFAAPAAAQIPPESMAKAVTLHDAIDLALRHAFSARIAGFRDDAADASVGGARVAFLPDLSGSIEGGISQRNLNTPNEFGITLPVSRTDDSLDATLTANYILLSTTRRLDLKAQQLRRESQSANTTTAKRLVVRDVARAYHQVVQSDALLKLAEQDLSRRTRHLEESRALVKGGKRAEFEVIRAEAELANSEASLVEAKNGARLSRSTLAQTVGTELPLEFTASAPTPPPDPRGDKKKPVQEIAADSMTRRIDVRGAEADAQAARLGYASVNRRYLPTVSVFARYNRLLNASETDLFDESFIYGAQLEVRFSDTLANVWRAKAARADARIAGVVADQTRVAVSLEIERASLELDRATEVLSATMKSADAARRNYESATERYRLGVASQTERIDAEAGLDEAEVNAARADVGYRIALWNLRYEMGEPLEAL